MTELTSDPRFTPAASAHRNDRILRHAQDAETSVAQIRDARLEIVARHRRITLDPAFSTAEKKALEAPCRNRREQTAAVAPRTPATRAELVHRVAAPPAGSCSGGEHRTDANHPRASASSSALAPVRPGVANGRQRDHVRRQGTTVKAIARTRRRDAPDVGDRRFSAQHWQRLLIAQGQPRHCLVSARRSRSGWPVSSDASSIFEHIKPDVPGGRVRREEVVLARVQKGRGGWSEASAARDAIRTALPQPRKLELGDDPRLTALPMVSRAG